MTDNDEKEWNDLADAINDLPKKKGRRSWKPASLLPQYKKNPGYRQRYVSKDEANIKKKLAEGWEFVLDENQEPKAVGDISGREVHDIGTIEDGKPLSSTIDHRELVLMQLPEELAKQRDEYYQNVVRKRRAGVKQKAQEDQDAAAKKAGIAGESLEGGLRIE